MSRCHSHHYAVQVTWTGNCGQGTSNYRAYSRDHEILIPGKEVIFGSSDPAFRGDATRYNPEELLVSALSACHMLWYLHLCAEAKIIVLAYRDQATGLMVETEAEGGHFQEVVLNPVVLIEGDADVAARLHERAHENCFIANSVNFPVRCTPTIQVASAQE